MGNLTLIARTVLYMYFCYVHANYLEAKKMEHAYVEEELEE